MSKIFVISDLHFGHKNMALYRGFDSVEKHDDHIVKMWNSVVGKKDTVWVLGDLTMEKSSPYYNLDLLNGVKKIVLGNHDMPKPSHNLLMLQYVNSICGVVTDRKGRYMMTHIPVHPNELNRYSINIHGHLHSENIDDPRYINVSCENIDYTPIPLDDILDRRVLKKIFLKMAIMDCGLFEFRKRRRLKKELKQYNRPRNIFHPEMLK